MYVKLQNFAFAQTAPSRATFHLLFPTSRTGLIVDEEAETSEEEHLQPSVRRASQRTPLQEVLD